MLTGDLYDYNDNFDMSKKETINVKGTETTLEKKILKHLTTIGFVSIYKLENTHYNGRNVKY
jgi:hypothetical protein